MDIIENKPLILIVDDVPQNLQVLGKILSKEGYRIASAMSGVQAIKTASETIPDLILLDVMMPDLDGYEVCRQIKESEITRDIPIIFITARAETEDIIKGFTVGAVDYATKPVNSAELLARVKMHLELRRSYKLLQQANEYIETQNKKMLSELEIARTVQLSILRNVFPSNADVDFHVKYTPSEKLSGDYYDIFPIDKDNYCMYVADVSGHGVPSAMISVYTYHMIEATKPKGNDEFEIIEPCDVLRALNRKMKSAHFQNGEYFTIFYGIYNVPKREFTYSAAAHSFAYHIKRKGKVKIKRLAFPSPAIGWIDDFEFPQRTIIIEPGDQLLILTDGIHESVNDAQEQYQKERFMKFMKECSVTECNGATLIEELSRDLKEFVQSQKQGDDITMLVMDVKR